MVMCTWEPKSRLAVIGEGQEQFTRLTDTQHDIKSLFYFFRIKECVLNIRIIGIHLPSLLKCNGTYLVLYELLF
jgi:hypothetical protein